MIPTFEQAEEILKKYNSERFHLTHAYVVSGVMRYFALQHDPENVEFWRVVGLLHDLDFELYPDQHCVKTRELMENEGIDKSVIDSAVSHGYGLTKADIKPEKYMEKILFATDELTGLIGAVAVIRPSKSVIDLELKSVKKKFDKPSFAAGCKREVISRGAEMLGISLDELIESTIMAMRSLVGEMQI